VWKSDLTDFIRQLTVCNRFQILHFFNWCFFGGLLEGCLEEPAARVWPRRLNCARIENILEMLLKPLCSLLFVLAELFLLFLWRRCWLARLLEFCRWHVLHHLIDHSPVRLGALNRVRIGWDVTKPIRTAHCLLSDDPMSICVSNVCDIDASGGVRLSL